MKNPERKGLWARQKVKGGKCTGDNPAYCTARTQRMQNPATQEPIQTPALHNAPRAHRGRVSPMGQGTGQCPGKRPRGCSSARGTEKDVLSTKHNPGSMLWPEASSARARCGVGLAGDSQYKKKLRLRNPLFQCQVAPSSRPSSRLSNQGRGANGCHPPGGREYTPEV